MRFRDRLRDEDTVRAISDGAIRDRMIRLDAPMGILPPLPPAGRGAALDALDASVRERGKRSVRTYRELVAGRPCAAHEAQCAASGGGACTFEVEPAAA